MALDIVDKNLDSEKTPDRGMCTDEHRTNQEIFDPADAVGTNLAQALAIINMMMYHFPTDSIAPIADDLLRCAIPVVRLLRQATEMARRSQGKDVARLIEQAASMASILAVTVEEEALGQSFENFQWLSEFVWALETQVAEAQGAMERAPRSRH